MASTSQDQSPKRGASPSPRVALAAATPFALRVGAPPQFLTAPQQLSFWGNYTDGDCVTAEEAFTKACHNPEIFITEDVAVGWARDHGVLNGAVISDVLTWMQDDGFQQDEHRYNDGQHYAVNWTHRATLISAISNGPVKIGVAADQLEDAWQPVRASGWVATGFKQDDDEDHCVSLCGYGSIAWLLQQLGGHVPAGVDGNAFAYALFTWNSIGVIDEPSMRAITHEAWLRTPSTIVL